MTTCCSNQSVPNIVTLHEIEKIVSTPEFEVKLIQAIQDGFVAYSQGRFNACPIQTMGAPPMAPFATSSSSQHGKLNNHDATKETKEYAAQTCVKSGYITSSSHYVIKVASGGHPFRNSGVMQLFSQTTGKLETLLLDEGRLTELRTAAAGAVAAKFLSPDLDVADGVKLCIGMLGTGIQARYQLRYLAHATSNRNVLVYGRTKPNVESFIRDMNEEGWNVRAVTSPQDLLSDLVVDNETCYCPLIVTTTSSRQPILMHSQQSASEMTKIYGRHITCIGSDSTGKIELDPILVSKADLLVADSLMQTKERGEYEEAIKRSLIFIDDVVELGDFVANKTKLYRKKGRDGRLTIFDSSGVAVQDCVVAMMVHETMISKGES